MNFMRSLQISNLFGRRAPSSCTPWSILSQPRCTCTSRRMATCSAAEKQPKLMQPLHEIEQELLHSIRAVADYAQGNPNVDNVGKLTRRIKRDLAYIRNLASQPPAQLTETRWQGCMNNLRGFKGEMLALLEAPNVVGVCKKFRAAAPPGTASLDRLATDDGSSSDGSEAAQSPRAETLRVGVSSGLGGAWQQQVAAAASNGSSSPRAAAAAAAEWQVEVDVVADGGLTWIEVKNQEWFGLWSGHWAGGSGRGLAEQVAQMLTVAAAPEHQRRGRSPQVVVFFPSGVDPEVAAALEEMGARVADGPGSLARVCGVVGNNVTNLDVTSLCALVSEVTWRDPHSEALKAWAARTTHWRDCLQAQQQRPLLEELEGVVGQGRELVVSCAAVSQFEILLQQFSGPLERQRWSQLLPQLRVYHCTAGCTGGDNSSSTGGASSGSTVKVSQQACAVCGESLVQLQGGHQQHSSSNGSSSSNSSSSAAAEHLEGGAVFPLSPRLQELDRMTLLQQAVFSLGDALHALTLTANGSAVRAAAACGVVLDAHTHRPVWLTGL